MKKMVAVCSLAVGLLASGASFAGFEEGSAAFQNKDYSTALSEWQPLAEKGDARAQFRMAWLYKYDLNAKMREKQVFAWYRKAAESRSDGALADLGQYYKAGIGVPQSKVAACALLKLSQSNPSDDVDQEKLSNVIGGLQKTLTDKEASEADALLREMSKPGNLLKALDGYMKSIAGNTTMDRTLTGEQWSPDQVNQVIKYIGFEYDSNAFFKACEAVKGSIAIWPNKTATGIRCAGGGQSKVELNFKENEISVSVSAIEDAGNEINKEDFEQFFVSALPCAKGCEGLEVNADRRWSMQAKASNPFLHKDLWYKNVVIKPSK